MSAPDVVPRGTASAGQQINSAMRRLINFNVVPKKGHVDNKVPLRMLKVFACTANRKYPLFDLGLGEPPSHVRGVLHEMCGDSAGLCGILLP